MTDALRFIVDDEVTQPRIKGALPLPAMGEAGAKVIELGTDAVASGVSAALSTIYKIIEVLPSAPEGHELSEIKFKLIIDARGEISILSAVKGGLSGQSGIEFTLNRKR